MKKSPRRVRSLARSVLAIGAGAYALMALGCSVFQRSMLYYPTRGSADAMDGAARSAGLERWRNAAGQGIGWKRLSPAQPAAGELLITHGNGGAAIHRVDYAQPLRDAARLDVYILEYPGYGDRAGKPGQKALFDAAEEAFESMPKKAPVYLLGESLGTGVAAHLAGRYPTQVAGLLLFAPYNSLDDVAQYHLRILPARWLMHDHFRSETFLQKYHGPVAVVVGGRDTIIPAKYGRRLLDGYQGPKRLWEFPEASHNELQPADPKFWSEVEAFLKLKRL